MKALKLRFVDFWPDFDSRKNLFQEILGGHFVIDDTGDPDFIIYSTFGYSHLDYDVPRIFFTGENVRPDFNICDYALAFDRMTFGDRYFRLPLYFFIRQEELHKIGRRQYKPDDRKFCNFVYSNPGADPLRDAFFHLLSRYKQVDSAGRHLNNTGFRVKDKVGLQRNYKFTIAFENSSTRGYSTEKIVDAYVAGTIPIYWGDPDVGLDFNPESYVNCHDLDNFEEVVERVVVLDTDENAYAKVYEAPFLRRPILRYAFDPGFEEFFIHIFEQGRDTAYRRNRQFWGKAYETQRRKFAHYITRLENRPLFNLKEHLVMWGMPSTVRRFLEKSASRKQQKKESRLRDA